MKTMVLWQHRNGFYYILYSPRLKQRFSTRTKDRGQAETRLEDMIAAGAAIPTNPTVGQILRAYRDQRGPEVRSPATLKFSVETLLRFFDNLAVRHLTPRAIKRFAQDRGAKPGTILREIGVLRAAFSWAVEHKWIDARDEPIISNPVKAPPPRMRWITKEEARRLVAACCEPHVKLFIMLGLMTVARTGAILEAKWAQVNWDQRFIDYGEGYGNKRRAIVPLNDEAFALLQAAKELASSDYIVGYRGGRVVSIKKGFAAACRCAGLVDVTPHILRHTGATWMALDGVPMREIARALGDSEATTERVYAKYHPDHLKRAVAALQLTNSDRKL